MNRTRPAGRKVPVFASGVPENPRNFSVHSGCEKSLCILKTPKQFSGKKFCKKFTLLYLEIVVKHNLFRINGSQFQKCLFGPEKFEEPARNRLRVIFKRGASVMISQNSVRASDLRIQLSHFSQPS